MAVVTRFLDAANHHDSDTLYASVHPAFESFQPLHPDRNFRGPGQLISNWKAIFEAEPGFRLTVLRASTTGNTVWVELHGAGDSAEAAGIFIVGVENGRIRWVRVYSDLVEGVAPEEHTEATPSAGATTEQAPGAVTEPEPSPPPDDGPRFVPAPAPAADDHDGEGDSKAVAGGPLRLAEPSDDPAPDTAGTSELPQDPGLRLVDPAASEHSPGGGGSHDPGPVETLVGPSRIVPARPAPADENRASQATPDEVKSASAASTDAASTTAEPTREDSTVAASDERWAPDRALDSDAAGADPFSGNPASDDNEGHARSAAETAAATDDASPNVVQAEPVVEPEGGLRPEAAEPAKADKEAGSTDDPEPTSFDVGSRPPPPEPVLSRLRKAFRKP